MARHITEGRDLRSLERRSMYSIFAPLDADERLPRELILEARRHKTLGRRELAGALWLPAVFLIVALIAWAGVSTLVAFSVVGLMYAGFWAFILFGDRASN
jgi:Flp pilus assembly protein TadB